MKGNQLTVIILIIFVNILCEAKGEGRRAKGSGLRTWNLEQSWQLALLR